MPKYIIFNTVKNDGVGDFNHFEDIVNEINSSPRFRGVELLLIVNYQPRPNDRDLYQSLLTRTSALGHEFRFGALDEHQADIESRDIDNLIDEFADVSQAIIVSYDDIFITYERFLPQTVVLKYVSEHDAATNKNRSIIYPNSIASCCREMHIRGMGLSSNQNAYGVKIKDRDQLTSDDALRVLQVISPDFLDTLIAATGVADEYELMRRYMIIPAYFSYNYIFVHFLRALAANPSIADSRDIIIYQSGANLSALPDMEFTFVENLLQQLPVINTRVYTESNLDSPLEYTGLGKNSVNISVFSGFRIPDMAYIALYYIAPLVGISGDNTLELAIETRTLPIYWSTNSVFKMETYQGLLDIIKNPRLQIDNVARSELIKFFLLSMHTYEYLDKYNSLNLPLLTQAWPLVADYIKKYHNFYNYLEEIVCEKLPRGALPAAKGSARCAKSLLAFLGAETENTTTNMNVGATSNRCSIS